MQSRTIRTIALTALSLTAFTIAAEPTDDPTPKTPAARAALAKLANAQEAAKKAHDKAIKEATEIAVKDLEAAKAVAMKGNNLDEANRIQGAIESLQSDGQQVSQVEIQAGRGWQKAIAFRKGDRVSLEATGKWCADPSRPEKYTFGPEPRQVDGKRFGLTAKVGDREQDIGAKWTFTAESDGVLMMKLGGGNVESDDTGSVAVNIRTAS